MEAGYGHFVCSFWRLMEGDKTNKHQNEISFLRFGDLYNATKRTNDKTKWPQNFILSRCRLFVLAPWPTRQNEETKKWNSIYSFLRLVQRDKTNKRRNEIWFWRSVVCSFSRLDQRDKTKKRRNEIPFLRFGNLYNATKRTNEEMKFGFGVLSFVRFRALTNAQNEETKKRNSISSFWRLVQRDKTNKRRNEIWFWRFVVCSFSRLD